MATVPRLPAVLGKGVKIGAGCYVGKMLVLGDWCYPLPQCAVI